MKKIYIITIAVIACLSNIAAAQNARFARSGTIEYEKSMNMYAIIKKNINKDNESYLQPAYDQYKKNQPQFKKLKSTLNFSDNKTLFVPIPPENTNNGFFGNSPMTVQNNTVYTDFNTNKIINQKKVYEETFLVRDSTHHIKWKITSETRDIAGYTCRRANGLVLDSVYVVAFYTEEIPVSGGPESFSGLPGMILGVALPHENVTWFATKVTDTPVPANSVAAPVKGKSVTSKEFFDKIKDVMKDWGDYAQEALKAYSL
ncbi:GLPGLI family protein [Mucilaginibacter gynuensis]|uniref:GLPGLI family protein n=1 Tax=Mucilaginibacter gynuensis TaxID=1302236 RepID=A0ABP8HGA5_9SPHI